VPSETKIEVACSGCGGRFRAPGTLAGKKVRCPKCKGVIEVPAPAPVPEPEPEAVEEIPEAPEEEPAAAGEEPAKGVAPKRGTREIAAGGRGRLVARSSRLAAMRDRAARGRGASAASEPRKGKGVLIAIIAVALVALGGGGFSVWKFVLKKPAAEQSGTPSQGQATSPEQQGQPAESPPAGGDQSAPTERQTPQAPNPAPSDDGIPDIQEP
jgi:hypothetical protein